MHPLIAAILAALADAPIAPASPDHEPAPWHAWLLVALGRQIERQRWAMRVRREHLSPPPPPRPAYTREHGWATGHPEVPGMPGWQFCFLEKSLLLVAPDEEEIRVRDRGDGGLTIDLHHFADRVRSIADPAHPERRLLAFFGTYDIITASIAELLSEGLVVPAKGKRSFRVAPEIEAAADALAAVDFDDEAVCARWSAHLGDHLDDDVAPSGDHAAEDLEGPEQRAQRAAKQREAYERYLLAGLTRKYAHAFVRPLDAALSPERFVEVCTQVIDGPIGGATGEALQCLNDHPDYPICPAVYRLLLRFDPALDRPFIVLEAAEYLFRRGIAREHAAAVAAAFARIDDAENEDNPILARLALLLLEHAPSHALGPIRRALRSRTHTIRIKSTAALVALAQPWCVRELLLALEEALTVEASAAVRWALLFLVDEKQADDEARLAVERWTSAHVERAPGTPGEARDAAAEGASGLFIERWLDDLSVWADGVRPGIDPDLDRVVWA